MKIHCNDCKAERKLTDEERLNINNDEFETHCWNCGAEWLLFDMLRD